MGQDQFAGNVLQVLLSWLQSLMSGVWSLFSGGGGGSVLRWFSDNWLGLLIVLMIIGVTANVLTHFLRWRPFWWWFRKKRLIVDDEIFETVPAQRPRSGAKPRNTTKPSTIVPRRENDGGDDLFTTRRHTDTRTKPRAGKKKTGGGKRG